MLQVVTVGKKRVDEKKLRNMNIRGTEKQGRSENKKVAIYLAELLYGSGHKKQVPKIITINCANPVHRQFNCMQHGRAGGCLRCYSTDPTGFRTFAYSARILRRVSLSLIAGSI